MRLALLLAVLSLLSAAGSGERIRVEGPRLSAYDADGRPIWELSAAELEGTPSGWAARGVTVRLFGADGEVLVEASIAEVKTDPQGTRWSSAAPVEGGGRGFVFRAERARWDEDGLSLEGLTFESGDLRFEAILARWNGGRWHLQGVAASFGEWEFEFPEGVYLQGDEVLEVPRGLVARGWGWEVRAERAVVDVPAREVTLWGVEVVEA